MEIFICFCKLPVNFLFFFGQEFYFFCLLYRNITSCFFIKNDFYRMSVSIFSGKFFCLHPPFRVERNGFPVKDWILPFDENQTVFAWHSPDFCRSHQCSPTFPVLDIGVSMTSKAPAIIPGINRHIPEQFWNILMCTFRSWSGSQIHHYGTVFDKDFPLILWKQCLCLRDRLQNWHDRHIPSADCSHQDFCSGRFRTGIKFICP